jgi:FAD synthetase
MPRVLAGGCFNRVHEGHLYFLREAKKLGDELVVVLASDSHNKKAYAKPAGERKKELDSLGLADKVVVGDSDGFIGTVLREKPGVIALGYDQKMPKDVQAQLAELKIKVIRIGKLGNHSTAQLVNRAHE